MKRLHRMTTSVCSNLRSVTREPFTLALLVLMPAVSIQLYGLSVASIAELGLFDTGVSLQTLGMVTGAVFGTAALTGILGLFQSLGIQTADRRLVISGFPHVELVAARLGTVVATALLVAVVTTISLDWLLAGKLGSGIVTMAGLFQVGLLFGLLGVLVGSVLPQPLEGSLVLVGVADGSAIVASGLFGISDDLTDLFPLSHPHDIVLQAVVDGSVATTEVLPALGYLLLIGVLAAAANFRALPSGGDPA